jgi:hypothetical protein
MEVMSGWWTRFMCLRTGFSGEFLWKIQDFFHQMSVYQLLKEDFAPWVGSVYLPVLYQLQRLRDVEREPQDKHRVKWEAVRPCFQDSLSALMERWKWRSCVCVCVCVGGGEVHSLLFLGHSGESLSVSYHRLYKFFTGQGRWCLRSFTSSIKGWGAKLHCGLERAHLPNASDESQPHSQN